MGGWTDFDMVVASLKSAADIARVLIAAEGTFDKAELKLKLADLMVALAEARTQAAGMQDSISSMADELADAKKKLAFAGTMVYEAPYYLNMADGQRDGPYCASCWDGRGKQAIRLYQNAPGYWICNTCKVAVFDKTYRDPELDPG
jgi:hypothetical protein